MGYWANVLKNRNDFMRWILSLNDFYVKTNVICNNFTLQQIERDFRKKKNRFDLNWMDIGQLRFSLADSLDACNLSKGNDFDEFAKWVAKGERLWCVVYERL